VFKRPDVRDERAMGLFNFDEPGLGFKSLFIPSSRRAPRAGNKDFLC